MTVSSSDFYGLTSAGGTFGRETSSDLTAWFSAKVIPLILMDWKRIKPGWKLDKYLKMAGSMELRFTEANTTRVPCFIMTLRQRNLKIHTFSSGSTDGGYPHEDVLELLCAPPSPDSIGGLGSVCKGSTYTYSVRPVKGATSL